MLTRDQKRAQAAFEKVAGVHTRMEQNHPFQKKYGGLCLKFPAMIQQNGLCQAVAFIEAKAADEKPNEDSNEYKLFLRDLAQVVLARPEATGATLAHRARTDDLSSYQWLARDALQCAVWLKRYAEAVLRIQPGEEVRD